MKYRKRPVEIEAHRFERGAYNMVAAWCGGDLIKKAGGAVAFLNIKTLEGQMRCDVGDWVIQGVEGEFYPCKPGIFKATYEPVPAAIGGAS